MFLDLLVTYQLLHNKWKCIACSVLLTIHLSPTDDFSMFQCKITWFISTDTCYHLHAPAHSMYFWLPGTRLILWVWDPLTSDQLALCRMLLWLKLQQPIWPRRHHQPQGAFDDGHLDHELHLTLNLHLVDEWDWEVGFRTYIHIVSCKEVVLGCRGQMRFCLPLASISDPEICVYYILGAIWTLQKQQNKLGCHKIRFSPYNYIGRKFLL